MPRKKEVPSDLPATRASDRIARGLWQRATPVRAVAETTACQLVRSGGSARASASSPAMQSARISTLSSRMTTTSSVVQGRERRPMRCWGLTRAQAAVPALDQHRVRRRVQAHEARLPPFDLHIHRHCRLHLDFVSFVTGILSDQDGQIIVAAPCSVAIICKLHIVGHGDTSSFDRTASIDYVDGQDPVLYCDACF